MMFLKLASVALIILSSTYAKAEVKDLSETAAAENSVIRAIGKNLLDFSACYSAVNQDTGETTCTQLPVVVNSKKTRASITMPFVEKDTKGSLVITSGPNAETQSFFILILNDERLTVIPQANDPSLPINVGDGLVDAIKGETGPKGPQGIPGPVGLKGDKGDKGDHGLACWDLNGNGNKDLPSEDTNSSGAVDVADCKGLVGNVGPAGIAGPVGPAGSFSGANPVFSNTATMDGVFKLRAQDNPPALPEAGDIYHDSSPAICAYLGSTWNKLTGTGTCAPGTDQEPNAFDFIPTSAPPSTLITSNIVTITGFDNAPISISVFRPFESSEKGIPEPEYSIDSGAFTSLPGTIYAGQTVQLRHTTRDTPNYGKIVFLTIGSVTDLWSVKTQEVDCPKNFAYIPGSVGVDSFGNPDANYSQGWCVSQYEMSPQDTSLWTQDPSGGWDYLNSSGAGKAITAKGGGDSFPIVMITRNEAAAACSNDLTTKDGTPLINGKLITVYFWSSISQAIIHDEINWSGSMSLHSLTTFGNLSRGNSDSSGPLVGVRDTPRPLVDLKQDFSLLTARPTDGIFHYTSEEGRKWRMGLGRDPVYDWAGNVWEWFDDLHNNAAGASELDINSSVLAYEHDNPNGPTNIRLIPIGFSDRNNTTNGVGKIYVNSSPLISGTTYAAVFGGSWESKELAGVYTSFWYSLSPSSDYSHVTGFRCIVPVQ